MRSTALFRLLGRPYAREAKYLPYFGLTLLLSSVLMVVLLSMMMLKNLIDDRRIDSKVISANSAAILMFADQEAGKELLSSFAASRPVMAAALFQANGELLTTYGQDDTTVPTMLAMNKRRDGYEIDLMHLRVVRTVTQEDSIIGYVFLSFDLGPFYQRLLGYVGMMLLVTSVAFLFMRFSLNRMKKVVTKAESELEYLAHTDPVTQLPNRHAFNKKLSESLVLASQARGEVGLILLDLDNFKVVNDTMGHQCGDALLRMFALRLLSATRRTDIVCRIGGDEFVIIIRRTGETVADVEDIATRILSVLAEPFKLDAQEFFLTASVGSSNFPRDAADSETLIRKADTAMYSAKMKGKNAFKFFIPEMDKLAQRRLTLENSLYRALERNELTLHYQPQIELGNRRIIGVEALMRWHHPDLGAISPVEFIPIAEETGLIVSLGKWALRTACRDLASWMNRGVAPIRMAVNISARQTRDPNLINDIQEILHETNLNPKLLELEITEGIMMENVHANIQLLQDLQSIGISLAIDDFGTGYSSMAYLKRFPINQLKIDRSFVNDIHGGGEAIISAILAMAHSLGISIVAEGVETESQLVFLESIGCDLAQGYYFSRPVSRESVISLLQQQVVEGPM